MIFGDGCDRPGRAAGRGRWSRRFARPRLIAVIWLATGLVLSACGRDDPGRFMVDPARFTVLHCKDLIEQMKKLQDREKQLRNLQAQASQGGGGTLMGNMAYRPEFETVLSQEKLVQRAAAEKKCELTPGYQSDQSIR